MENIVLLTDFGLADPYVGQLKGRLADLCPKCRILDLSHGVEPFAVAQAAFFLRCSWSHFPAQSIFICVVDPGVGGKRDIVLLTSGERHFLAPDNGLLSLVMSSQPDATARLVDGAHLIPSPSTTFHGRDIFAPLAAKLANGTPASDLGREVPAKNLVQPRWSAPIYDHGDLTCNVLHVDRFGNCILNLETATWLPVLANWPGVFLHAHRVVEITLAHTYVELAARDCGLISGGQGFLELARNMYSATDFLGLDLGDEVHLSPGRGTHP